MSILSTFPSTLPFTSTSTSTSTCTSLPSSFTIRLQSITLGFHSTLGQNSHIHAPVVVQRRGAVITKASADPNEPNTTSEGGEATDQGEKTEVQNLPLESKLQLKQEQKLKMKNDKRIRLRRKRLVRKRALRKKGRWPPSKMRKLKNV